MKHFKEFEKRYEICNKKMKKNFLIKQYISDKKMKIRHNYLSEQFKNSNKIFNYIKNTVEFNDFTLGRYVEFSKKNFVNIKNQNTQ